MYMKIIFPFIVLIPCIDADWSVFRHCPWSSKLQVTAAAGKPFPNIPHPDEMITWHHIVSKSRIARALNFGFCEGHIEIMKPYLRILFRQFEDDYKGIPNIPDQISLIWENILSDPKSNSELSKLWKYFMRAFIWNGNNLVLGPEPGIRTDDPHSGFERNLCWYTGCPKVIEKDDEAKYALGNRLLPICSTARSVYYYAMKWQLEPKSKTNTRYLELFMQSIVALYTSGIRFPDNKYKLDKHIWVSSIDEKGKIKYKVDTNYIYNEYHKIDLCGSKNSTSADMDVFSDKEIKDLEDLFEKISYHQ